MLILHNLWRRFTRSFLTVLGIAVGVATVVFAKVQDWRVVIPPTAAAVGLGGAVIIGALAGLYPAIRAARLSPTDALRGV